MSLLDHLRTRTKVDCDTLDVSVASKLGPFEDCTSNQALAFAELSNTKHSQLLQDAAKLAKENISRYQAEDASLTIEELATEISMLRLGLAMLPHLRGRLHIQINPFSAYSTERCVRNATRLQSLYTYLVDSPRGDRDRLCIKIPSTWEGLHACSILETPAPAGPGIRTLATTLFSVDQAILARGCSYIAPYVYDLTRQVDATAESSPNLDLPLQAQTYYRHVGSPTKVYQRA